MATASLYRRLLGLQFDVLPPVLQRFHDQPGGGKAHGQFDVERNRGRIANILASLLKLPKAGRSVPISLEVITEGDRERWIRSFAGQIVETVQWASNNYLMESFGHTSFSSKLVVDGSRLCYQFHCAWYRGIRLPLFLSPCIKGVVEAGETGWIVDVRIAAPVLGWLVHYRGWIEPD
jgi:hypothetical protein